MKYNFKRNKNISLVVILFFIFVSCLLAVLSINEVSVDLIFLIFLFISSSIIIHKLVVNFGCYALVYDDYIHIKNKEEMTIKFIDISKIEIELIIKEKFIIIYYGNNNQVKLEYLKSLYLNLNTKL